MLRCIRANVCAYLPIVCVASCFAACSHLPFLKNNNSEMMADQEQAEPPSEAVSMIKASALEEQELKLARLWARVDELEEEQFRQREKVHLLEKGLTLGLVPEGLRENPRRPKKPTSAGESSGEGADKAVADLTDALDPIAQGPALKGKMVEHDVEQSAGLPLSDDELSKEESERYQKMLAEAQEQFRAGRYARAAVEFSQIDKVFGGRVKSGIHVFFLAQCWTNLKEYATARSHLSDFMKTFPASPWMPRAKVELARTELQLGMRDTATDRLREVVQQHPYEDAAELARMELERLKKTL